MGPLQLAGQNGTRSTYSYDPLGYFARGGTMGQSMDDMALRRQYGRDMAIDEDAEVDGNGKKQSARTLSMQSVVKKQFVLVAVGLAIGYIVASWSHRQTNNDQDKRK